MSLCDVRQVSGPVLIYEVRQLDGTGNKKPTRDKAPRPILRRPGLLWLPATHTLTLFRPHLGRIERTVPTIILLVGEANSRLHVGEVQETKRQWEVESQAATSVRANRARLLWAEGWAGSHRA